MKLLPTQLQIPVERLCSLQLKQTPKRGLQEIMHKHSSVQLSVLQRRATAVQLAV